MSHEVITSLLRWLLMQQRQWLRRQLQQRNPLRQKRKLQRQKRQLLQALQQEQPRLALASRRSVFLLFCRRQPEQQRQQ